MRPHAGRGGSSAPPSTGCASPGGRPSRWGVYNSLYTLLPLPLLYWVTPHTKQPSTCRQRHAVPANTNSSACLPPGYLQGHYMTPGAKQHLQQHLAPPPLPPGLTEGLFEVEHTSAGGLEYVRVADVRKLIILESR